MVCLGELYNTTEWSEWYWLFFYAYLFSIVTAIRITSRPQGGFQCGWKAELSEEIHQNHLIFSKHFSFIIIIIIIIIICTKILWTDSAYQHQKANKQTNIQTNNISNFISWNNWHFMKKLFCISICKCFFFLNFL